jgi:CRISPR-associated protein Csm1
MSLTIHHVVFAALMHDIGKVVQRSGAADVEKYINKCRKDPKTGVIGYKHAMWTADFLSRHPIHLPDSSWEAIVELAGSHHCKDSWTMHNYDVYLDMIKQADCNSSSWDREESEESAKEARRYLKIPLFSVFSHLCSDTSRQKMGGQKWVYPLQKLSPDSVFPEAERTLKEQTAEYSKLLSGFEADYSKLCDYYNGLAANPHFDREHFPQFINAVDSLLSRYFWCVPANTMEAHPVGSLYHHLHNSATIAGALFAKHASSTPNAEPTFMIISGDLNGIQNYLYDLNPENSTKASKLLRSRSFQIQMIMEMAAEKVIAELGLSAMSIFANHGGKFFILAHNSAENIARLKMVKQQFNEDMFKRFLGSVSLNLGWETKLGLADLNKKHFLKTMEQCFDEMEVEKHAKHSCYLQTDEHWRSESFVINREDIYSNQICDFCKRRAGDPQSSDEYRKYESIDDTDTQVCSSCLQEIRLGRNLAQKKYFKIWQGEAEDSAYISFAGMHFGEAKKYELESIKPGVRYFSLDLTSELVHIPIRYLATHVPQKDGRVCTFEDITKQSCGLKANATIKGDVDNLGYIMSRSWPKNAEGDPECSITDFCTLSFMTDYFFSAVLPHMVKDKYVDSIYTVYSGGDDFCLIGAYDKIIDFAGELNTRFSSFCAQNPELHFSAAITLNHPKEPVRFVIKSTDDRLTEVKGIEGKNYLNLYETPVPWKDLANLMKFSNQLENWLAEGDITLQFLYRLLAYHQMYLETKRSTSTNIRNYLYDSLLNYDIKRNIQKINNDRVSNQELVNTLKNLTGLQEGSMMRHLRIPLCHAIYKKRKANKGVNHE